MKFTLVVISLGIILCLFQEPLLAQETKETKVSPTERADFSNLITPFLRALKEGDVQTIKASLSEDMYREYKTLLEQNTDYPRFLMEYYKNVDLSISDIVRIGGEVVVKVTRQFSGGPPQIIEFRLSQGPNDTSLKVGRIREEKRKKNG